MRYGTGWRFVRTASRALAAWVLAALGAGLWPSAPQAVTHLEQAERLQAVYAYLLDFRPAGAPRLPPRGLFELQAEAIPAPSVDHRVGAKDEPIDPPSAIPRLRAKYLSAAGLMLGATANPATEVQGYAAPWAGGELGWRARLGALHGELRGYVLSARVTGPITESGARDEFTFVNQGADLRLGLAWGRLMPYAGVGAGHSESTLTVEADGAQFDASLDYRYWMAGATIALEPFLFTFEQNRTEDFLSHYILAVAVQF